MTNKRLVELSQTNSFIGLHENRGNSRKADLAEASTANRKDMLALKES